MSSTPMIAAETVLKTLDHNSIVTRLIAREDIVAFSRRESFQFCTHTHTHTGLHVICFRVVSASFKNVILENKGTLLNNEFPVDCVCQLRLSVFKAALENLYVFVMDVGSFVCIWASLPVALHKKVSVACRKHVA
jgi:hypothetical protein